MKAIIAAVLASTVALTGCQSAGPKETVGGVVGAGAGAAVGSLFGGGKGQIAMAVIGGLPGSQVGAGVGQSLDNIDRQMERQSGAQALESYPTGQTSTWQNPDTGHSGTFTPTSTYQQSNGAYCREFQQTINVGGQVQDGHGTACRQPDGTWKIQG